jgi:RNA polymerase sigma-70 factor (ECF subfamily)
MVDDQIILDFIKDEHTKEKGFRILLTTYQERVYWHIRRIVEIHEDADDVMQNTFIKIYRSIDKFKGDSTLYTWINRIATNESITFLRARKKRISESFGEGNEYLLEQLKSDPYFNESETNLKLAMAIDSLPERQKMVFNMRYFEEMKYDEIAEILSLKVGGLKASYHLAVKKIEEYLKK